MSNNHIPATVTLDGNLLLTRMAPGNTAVRAAVIVNDVAVLFGTINRAAEAAASIDPYEPVYAWVPANDRQPTAWVYIGLAGDILGEMDS